MPIRILAPRDVRDEEKGRPLKQHDLVRATRRAKGIQHAFEPVDARYQRVHDGAPGLVEGLIPYRRGKGPDGHGRTYPLQLKTTRREYLVDFFQRY